MKSRMLNICVQLPDASDGVWRSRMPLRDMTRLAWRIVRLSLARDTDGIMLVCNDKHIEAIKDRSYDYGRAC